MSAPAPADEMRTSVSFAGKSDWHQLPAVGRGGVLTWLSGTRPAE
ncbi:hypothetical protein [Flexivirga caeni]|nr:hypothetical protein [Flexivirga caeni]